MLSLIGCTAGGKLATFEKGDARLAVDLPDVCDAFLQKVPEPPATAKTDKGVAAVRYADAFHEANYRIVAGAECHQDERAAYGTDQAKGAK